MLRTVEKSQEKRKSKTISYVISYTQNLYENLYKRRPKLSSLDVTGAALLSEFWHFGGDGRSLRSNMYRVQTFRSCCLLGFDGNPETWTATSLRAENAWVPRSLPWIFSSHAFCCIRSRLSQPIPMWTRTRTYTERLPSLKQMDVLCGWRLRNLCALGNFSGKAGMSDEDLRVGSSSLRPRVRIRCFHCCSLGSIPAWGTRILQEAWCNHNKIKKQAAQTWDRHVINGHVGKQASPVAH